MHRVWVVFAALAGGFSVAAGALAAHGASDARAAALLGIAAQYGLAHAVALLALAALRGRAGGFAERLLEVAAWAFAAGLVLFSGSLFALALTGAAVLGAATPFGGTSFLLGWATLLLYAWKAAR
jgi:uncharacterized membrane protein YgdD (TMEM256/DUF423 family)